MTAAASLQAFDFLFLFRIIQQLAQTQSGLDANRSVLIGEDYAVQCMYTFGPSYLNLVLKATRRSICRHQHGRAETCIWNSYSANVSGFIGEAWLHRADGGFMESCVCRSVGRNVVVFAVAGASVADGAGLGERALEDHHHPFARDARPACVRAVRQARTRRVESFEDPICSGFLRANHEQHRHH